MQRSEKTVWKTDAGKTLMEGEPSKKLDINLYGIDHDVARELIAALCNWMGIDNEDRDFLDCWLAMVQDGETMEAFAQFVNSRYRESGKVYYCGKDGFLDYHTDVTLHEGNANAFDGSGQPIGGELCPTQAGSDGTSEQPL